MAWLRLHRQPVVAAAVGRGVDSAGGAGLGGPAARVGGVATACPAGDVVQRRRRRTHHRRRLLRRRLLPFRHPVLVQRPGPHGADRLAPGVPRLSGGASQQHPLRRAGDVERPEPSGPVSGDRSDRVRGGAGYADGSARPDRGGDLRTQLRPGARRRRAVRGHGNRTAAALGDAAGVDRRCRGAERWRRDPRARGSAARFDTAFDADGRPAHRSRDPGVPAKHRTGRGGVSASRPKPLAAADRLRLDLRRRRGAGAADGRADRPRHGEPDRAPRRQPDQRRRTRARRGFDRARGGDIGAGRARRAIAGLQPHDRSTGGAAQ